MRSLRKINIRDWVKSNSTILKDRPVGERLRIQLRIDEKDLDDESYEIYFDDNFKSLNSSFFLGLFEKSIQTLGRKGFFEKYSFKCKPVFSEKIEACVMVALVVIEE